MCLDRRPPQMPDRQGGFFMPLAIFVLVGMALLASMLWRTSVQTHTSTTQELISTQAFYAAESGAQTAMSRLFYPDASSQSVVDSQCTAMDSLTLDFSVEGLNACQAQVTCECINENGDPCSSSSEKSYYTLTSVGQCQVSEVRAERHVEVSTFMKNDG